MSQFWSGISGKAFTRVANEARAPMNHWRYPGTKKPWRRAWQRKDRYGSGGNAPYRRAAMICAQQ